MSITFIRNEQTLRGAQESGGSSSEIRRNRYAERIGLVCIYALGAILILLQLRSIL